MKKKKTWKVYADDNNDDQANDDKLTLAFNSGELNRKKKSTAEPQRQFQFNPIHNGVLGQIKDHTPFD